jgi:gas vesicle protein
MANKKVKGSGHFIEGALIGAALGVAAGIFAGSKTGKKVGKEVKRNVKHQSIEFYKYIAPRIRKAKRMSETQYKVFVKEAVKSYGKGRKLSTAETADLLKEAQSLWAHLNREFKQGKQVKKGKKK